ncbi:MAG: hypothetical protein GY895_07605 [Phycisphaera sp.]|nr:hypothetical protein [Phycisphaera sp.]
MKRRLTIVLGLFVLMGTGGILLVPGCGSAIPNRNPTGEILPTVGGRDLDDAPIVLPTALADAPAVVMIGYVQGTQFDIDRWMLGMVQSESKLRLVEVPAVGGWFPDMFLQSTIDNGMRSGIPAESWSSVVTLYGEDAQKIQEFTGTERPRNARVLLLDSNGLVIWFWDQGYSPARLVEMLETASNPK